MIFGIFPIGLKLGRIREDQLKEEISVSVEKGVFESI